MISFLRQLQTQKSTPLRREASWLFLELAFKKIRRLMLKLNRLGIRARPQFILTKLLK